MTAERSSAASGSWRDALLDPTSFFPVLLLCIATMIVFPFTGLFRGGGIIAFPFAAALVFVALHRSGVKPRTMRSALATIAFVATVLVASVIIGFRTDIDERHLLAVEAVGFALLFAVVFPSVVRTALGHRRVNLNTLTAAISAYLIIGLWFTMIFLAMGSVHHAQFFTNVVEPSTGDFEYFSFITLTAVGYGDLAPVTLAGRAGAVALAVLGQVYLVTTVARVVSLYGSERRERSTSGLQEFKSQNPE